jgi:hypothetical protein
MRFLFAFFFCFGIGYNTFLFIYHLKVISFIHVLAIVNNPDMNTHVWISTRINDLISGGRLLGLELVSHTVNILKTVRLYFKGFYTALHSHRLCMTASLSPRCLSVCLSFPIANPTGCEVSPCVSDLCFPNV